MTSDVLLQLLLSTYAVVMLCLTRVVCILAEEAVHAAGGDTAAGAALLSAAKQGTPPALRQQSSFAPPMASADEKRVIEAAAARLNDPGVAPAEFRRQRPRRELLELQLLRHVRALGAKATPEALTASFMRAWDRRSKNRNAVVERGAAAKPWQMPADGGGEWPAAGDLMHGEWAVRFVKIGLNCGRTREGCPVKVERIGTYDTAAIFMEESGESRLKEFYHTLLESQAEALDADSLVAGKMLRAYEVFDLKGIRLDQVNWGTLRFAKGMLTTFAMCYPETTCRAVRCRAARAAACRCLCCLRCTYVTWCAQYVRRTRRRPALLLTPSYHLDLLDASDR